MYKRMSGLNEQGRDLDRLLNQTFLISFLQNIPSIDSCVKGGLVRCLVVVNKLGRSIQHGRPQQKSLALGWWRGWEKKKKERNQQASSLGGFESNCFLFAFFRTCRSRNAQS